MRKTTQKYYFSVEGETEKWYFDWLQEKINSEPAAKHKVSIDSKIQNPIKRAKSINVLTKTEIIHVFDYESNDEVHTVQFIKTLDSLKDTSKLGKQIKYYPGYSNFTFELWMVLHKAECNAPLVHRRQYLEPINKAYGEKFENLDQYKHEANFKRVLGKISLPEVIAAINRSKVIVQKNMENGLVLQQYKGYQYYRENPALSVWESIEKILKYCELL
ncbi:MAG: RloB domain-containing protein [Syntrophomonadaceae bacterium]|nr:RloB domain-containing protein [Syntrophomonadaceae bacterium]